MTTLSFVCWLTVSTMVSVILYPFTLYPFLLWILSKVRSRPWKRSRIHPSVSILISAHNEERNIRDKLQNTIALFYPRERLEIIVVCDGCTDNTERIVEEFAPQVLLLRTEGWVGKPSALNQAVAIAKGEFFVFTDVGSLWDPGTLEGLVSNFADATIGAVTTVPSFLGMGESAYQRLDFMVRDLEGRLESCTGCCGTLYAVRGKCHEPFSPSDASDFSSALTVAKHGLRIVVDKDMRGVSRSTDSCRASFARRVRTIVGGMDTLWRSNLSQWGYRRPLFLWFLWSHKIVRWFGPVAALAALVTILAGAFLEVSLMRESAIAVGLILSCGVLGLLSPNLLIRTPFQFIPFAIVSLVAGLYAWIEFLSGTKYVVWKPTIRERMEPPKMTTLREVSSG